MATARIEFRLGSTEVITGGSGLVAFDLIKRAQNVQNTARRLVPVDKGRLRNSIVKQPLEKRGTSLAVKVGTNVSYALAVHEGHGVIYPRNGRYLVFPGRDGKLVFAKRVRAVAGRPFLLDALPAAAQT